MGIKIRPSGPIPAPIMIVGEYPSWDDEAAGEPFMGTAGYELTRMLHEVGISRSECFLTNVCRERPPGNDISTLIAKAKKDVTPLHVNINNKYVKSPIAEGYNLLHQEIKMVKPSIIIGFGNLPLWALTGIWGITKWRGSMLHTNGSHVRFLPTHSPSAILRQWDLRSISIRDLRRAAEYRSSPYPVPAWRFLVRPSASEVLSTLNSLRLRAATDESIEISFDLETRHGHIACAGLSWNINEALSIPFMCVENREGYWGPEEEAEITYELYRLLTHPNVNVVGQNLLYDSQYTLRHWHFIPHVTQDTMISHHVAFAGLPKRLDFQASMYCKQYVYWKDDGKQWDKHMGEEQLWRYNAEDCVRTQECAQVEREMISKMGLVEVDKFQQSMFWPVLQAMSRGVLIDLEAREAMRSELAGEMTKREKFFLDVLGHKLNPRSPKQMQELFYTDLKLPIIMKRGTGKPTLDDDALDRLSIKEPLVLPLIRNIREYRSLGVFLGTFVEAELDVDDRMRCSYNICGTETFRLSSSANAFDSGTNLQNIPKGTKAKEAEDLSLPNIRKIFIPDSGYTFFDMDLDRADLQVVVWEADDHDLKKALRMGVDMHCMNAVDIFRIKGIPVDELVESHPNYRERRSQIGEDKRQRAKMGVHAVDYYCKENTLAVQLGITRKEAAAFIEGWYSAHPGIKRWHEHTERQLTTRRFVENRYGYRRFYFDRVEGLLPEALAWIPQSTVAITINKIWHNIYHHLPEVQVLLQVHDSLAGQFPKDYDISRILPYTRIPIPYQDPLIIPVGFKVSDVSWGDCS